MAEQVEWVPRPRAPRRLVEFQVTKQHRRFVEFANAVRRHRYIGACYGAPGLGKTLSAPTYAAADDYDEWERDRYSRGNVLSESLVASRTLFYTPLVHVTGRRLNLEVDMFAGSLSADINRALNPNCQPDMDEFVDIPYLTELVIIDEADRLKTNALEQLRDFFDRNDVGLMLIGMPGFERQLGRYSSSAPSRTNNLAKGCQIIWRFTEPVEERPALVAPSATAAIPSARPDLAAVADHRQSLPVDAVDHGLDVEAVDRVWAAVEGSTSDATKAAYRSDWARFEAWVAAGGHQVLPASPMVVAAYLTGAAEERKADGRPAFGSASLSRWASSINQVHTAAGFSAPGRSEVVRRALSGVRRARKTPPKRRSPLLLADVRSLLAAMRPSMTVWPAAMAAHRDTALLLMGFAGAHRRSELVNLRISDVTVHPADGLHVKIRSSKTDQEGQVTVRALPYGRDPQTCPPCALVRWRRLLLSYVTDDGGRSAALAQLRHRGLSTEHVCRSVDDTASRTADLGANGDDPAGAGAGAGGGGGERGLFPTIHKTGNRAGS